MFTLTIPTIKLYLLFAKLNSSSNTLFSLFNYLFNIFYNFPTLPIPILLNSHFIYCVFHFTAIIKITAKFNCSSTQEGLLK